MAKAKTETLEKDELEKVLGDLNKRYGKGTLISGKDIERDLEVVSTGSLTLDIATSIGGVPIGKLIEIFGMESSGKSTMCYHMIAEFQRAGKRCVLVDSESSFDKKYAEALGIDTDAIIYSQPECMEDAYNIITSLVKTNQISLIIFDSHTSSQPRKVVDGDVGDATMALQARVNSTAVAKLHAILKEHKTTVVGISQYRQNIGGYGDPNVTTGGLAWKFYSDMRLKVSKKVEKDSAQNRTTVEVIKNKCGVPFGKAEFSIIWGEGVDRKQELIDLAVEKNIIKLAGAGWYTLEDDTKVQGDNALKQMFIDNPEYAKQLETKVLNAIK
jgi:recombination protein RecA